MSVTATKQANTPIRCQVTLKDQPINLLHMSIEVIRITHLSINRSIAMTKSSITLNIRHAKFPILSNLSNLFEISKLSKMLKVMMSRTGVVLT
jgi:hypothetical protein